jgi:hypothetical protein
MAMPQDPGEFAKLGLRVSTTRMRMLLRATAGSDLVVDLTDVEFMDLHFMFSSE